MLCDSYQGALHRGKRGRMYEDVSHRYCVWEGTLGGRFFSLSGLNGGRSVLQPMCFPGDCETFVKRGDKQITITFTGKKYNVGESGTITP